MFAISLLLFIWRRCHYFVEIIYIASNGRMFIITDNEMKIMWEDAVVATVAISTLSQL
jgi:hypothetical protein